MVLEFYDLDTVEMNQIDACDIVSIEAGNDNMILITNAAGLIFTTRIILFKEEV